MDDEKMALQGLQIFPKSQERIIFLSDVRI